VDVLRDLNCKYILHNTSIIVAILIDYYQLTSLLAPMELRLTVKPQSLAVHPWSEGAMKEARSSVTRRKRDTSLDAAFGIQQNSGSTSSSYLNAMISAAAEVANAKLDGSVCRCSRAITGNEEAVPFVGQFQLCPLWRNSSLGDHV